MANNDFRTTQYILDDTYIRFWNSLSFAKTASRDIEEDFGSLRFATGQTLNYRLEERYLGGEGATALAEARVQIVKPLSITKQFHQLVDYSGFNLTFDRARDEPYLEMANAPRAKRLANMVENFIAKDNLQKQLYQAIGTPGVPVDLNLVLQTSAYMTELGIPEDGKRFMGMRPTVSATLSNDLFNVFNQTVNTGALIDGFIGHLSGLDMFNTVFLQRQIAGAGEAGGSPPTGFKLAGTVTNGPITGGNTISVTGLGQAPGTLVFREGDSIEIDEDAGVFMINALTYEALETRAQFVVTADVISADGSTANIPVNPTIVTDASSAQRNISAPIPNGAQVLLARDHNVSVAYHKQCIVFAAPPLKELRGGAEARRRTSELYKLSMTYTLGADVKNYEQLDRMDVICGTAINAQFGVRVRS